MATGIRQTRGDAWPAENVTRIELHRENGGAPAHRDAGRENGFVHYDPAVAAFWTLSVDLRRNADDPAAIADMVDEIECLLMYCGDPAIERRCLDLLTFAGASTST